ncbi:EcsC family protein [Fulvivirga sp. RKSG066]|uniref:EcsC family protein n=1 Tax=Fulvivirga aurantia TaxID=2529383 RepID=UPI0012BB54A1|nr:EcsC family protein [Fulvivirga aurantia]MTI22925.1 EcsC family protein [Fulvivirga aurantia]
MNKLKIDQRTVYYKKAFAAYQSWCFEMSKKPSLLNQVTKGTQHKINNLIPEKVHRVITKAIKEITRGVLFGAGYTTIHHFQEGKFELAEQRALKQVDIYSSSSAVEGAVTGFGGFLSGLADFPLWLSLKMKMLFEIAASYGFDTTDYKERLYILHIFQLTFSSQKKRVKTFEIMSDWEKQKDLLPDDINAFDWKSFQLEYRDFIDLAKLIQLIPGIGAIAGAYVNHRYTRKLGDNAINAYRLRLEAFNKQVKNIAGSS